MSTSKARTFAIPLAVALVTTCVLAADGAFPERKELKHADFVGNTEMEVLTSFYEIKPGEGIPRHTHNGLEAGYVIQGAMIQAPGKDPIKLETGGNFLWSRDVPHAGFKVIGDTSLKLFTVHVVDKGKPLAVASNQ